MPHPTIKNEGDFSRGFYFSLFIIAVVTLIIGFYFLPSNRYETFIGFGDSMEPTLLDGDELIVDPKRIPVSGDIIVFSCSACDDANDDEILTKRLFDINEKGCYWLLGDNEDSSFDSRTFGWLCDEDIKIFGVVVKVNQN